MTTTSTSSGQYRCQHLPPALFRRELRPARPPYGDFYHVFLLSSGKAVVAFAGERHEMELRGAFAFPHGCDATLTLQAGGEAYLVGVAPELLIDAIGNKAESVLMRIFTERPALVDLAAAGQTPNPDPLLMAKCFLAEAGLQGNGSDIAIAAYMRLIVMAIWRTSGWDASADMKAGQDTDILQRFRRLVELHFRQRKPIAAYASNLGLSHDRLHAICTRTLGRTPKALIQQRVLQEANLRLERSGQSIQQIAHQLGFPDQTYFSHFYRRATGISPATFRRNTQSATHGERNAEVARFAEWP